MLFSGYKKAAIVTPVVKKPGLSWWTTEFLANLQPDVYYEGDWANSRQLVEGASRKNSMMPLVQSACRQSHSTETAFLKVISDIIDAADCQKVTLLGLVDMSAVFDTDTPWTMRSRCNVWRCHSASVGKLLSGSARSSPTDCNLLLLVAVYLLRGDCYAAFRRDLC